MSSFEIRSPLGGERPDATLSEFDRKVAAALNNPAVHMLLLQEFKDYLVQYGALNQPPIPISQIFGFTQFTAQSDTVNTSESTTSTTFTDLSTTGPELTGLPDGQYVLFFGAACRPTTEGALSIMSVQVNGDAADDQDSIFNPNAVNELSISRAITKTLDGGGNNTLTAKYRSSVGSSTAVFQKRWLIALRYANL